MKNLLTSLVASLITLSVNNVFANSSCSNFSGEYGNPKSSYWVYNQIGCEKILAKYCIGNNCGDEYTINLNGQFDDSGSYGRAYSINQNIISVKTNTEFYFRFDQRSTDCSFKSETWTLTSTGNINVHFTKINCDDGYVGDAFIEMLKKF